MNQQSSSPFFNSLMNSSTLKAIIVGLLAFLFLLALQMFAQTVKQKSAQQQTLIEQDKLTWGHKQQIIGPILVIPYTDHVSSVDTVTEGTGESRVVTKDIYTDSTAIILPSTLEVRADLNEPTTDKNRLKTSTYKANISLSGRFDNGFLLADSKTERQIHWSKAYLSLGITDTRALIKATAIQWQNEKVFLQPDSQLAALLPNGLHAPLEKLDAKTSSHDFKIDLVLYGSDQFLVAPLGETTTVRLSSSWEQPDFRNSLTPNKQEQNKLGFTASWEVSNLIRNYPQTWLLEDKRNFDLKMSSIGVDLLDKSENPANKLQDLLDAAWVILLSFGILLAFDLITQQKLHLLQYALFGLSQLLFFLGIHWLSLNLAFKTSFLIAAASTLALSLAHSSLIFKSIFQGLLITAYLSGLYYLLYLIQTDNEHLPLLAAGYGLGLASLGLVLAWSLSKSPKVLRPESKSETEEDNTQH